MFANQTHRIVLVVSSFLLVSDASFWYAVPPPEQARIKVHKFKLSRGSDPPEPNMVGAVILATKQGGKWKPHFTTRRDRRQDAGYTLVRAKEDGVPISVSDLVQEALSGERWWQRFFFPTPPPIEDVLCSTFSIQNGNCSLVSGVCPSSVEDFEKPNSPAKAYILAFCAKYMKGRIKPGGSYKFKSDQDDAEAERSGYTKGYYSKAMKQEWFAYPSGAGGSEL